MAITDALFSKVAETAKARDLAKTRQDDLDKYELLVSAMQPHQRELHESTSKFDAVVTARQVGKTWGVLLLIFAACVKHAEQSWVIVGPTLKNLKRVYIPAYVTINRTFGLGVVFNKTDHTLTFPNGSVVYLHGADTSDAIERIRGGTFNGIAVDEAQFYPLSDLNKLVDDVAVSALKVKRGRLIMVGTPGPVLDGQFYAATCDPPRIVGANGEPSNYGYGSPPTGLWCRHSWSAKANLAAPHAWEEGIKLKELKGWPDDHPTWLREYLGKWAPDADTLVYKFDAVKNTYAGELPEVPPGHEWKYILGADLGQKDGTAIVVWAFSTARTTLYEVYSGKLTNRTDDRLRLSSIAEWYWEIKEKFGEFIAEVCDAGGLGQLILDELNDTYGINWEPIPKHGKEDILAMFNDDLEFGNIRLRKNSTAYIAEITKHVWAKGRDGNIPPVGRRTESDKTPNDICDAGLYGFRWAMHRLSKEPNPTPRVPDEWIGQEQRYLEEKRELIRLIMNKQHASEIDELEAICRVLN